MRILMTGGTGLVGQALGAKLTSEGHTLTVLSRNPDLKRLSYKAEIYKWDGELEPPPKAALIDTEAVIHLAGEGVADKRWTPERKRHLRQSRIASAHQLRVGLESAGVIPKYYIGASGVGYYGDQSDRILTEDAKSGSGFLADLCVEWEAAHKQVKAEHHSILRLGAVLSPDGGFLGKIIPMFRTFGASRLGSGKQWLSWIHIEDLVEVVTSIVNGKVSGNLNCVSPSPVTNAEMTKILRQTLRTFPAPPVPAFALKLLYGELAGALLESQRALPDALLREGFKFKFENFQQGCEHLRR
jgi:uncharacterized protein (TIGR01777 family)